MDKHERPEEQPPNTPEPPPFDPDEDLIGEIERGPKPDKDVKHR